MTSPPSPSPSPKPSHIDIEGQTIDDVKVIDYAKRSQWLRAAVLGANDGLLSIATLIMGVGALRKDSKTMILTGMAGLIGGACSMAIGEFVSVYSQYDIEVSQLKRENKYSTSDGKEEEAAARDDHLPNPWHAALASALAFAAGATFPLLGAAFIEDYVLRLVVIMVVVSLALLGFGGLAGVLGGANVVKSSLRMLVGGLLAMGITFGLTKSFGRIGI